MAKNKYTFFAPQFMEREKAPGWYTTIAVAGLIIALFFIFFMHRYLAAVVTVLSVIVLFRYASLKAKKQEIAIDDEGIKVGKNFYPYEKLVGFWFIETQDGLLLYLKTKKRFFQNSAIPLENKDPEEIRMVISAHLPELPSQGEDILDRVGRILRF
ncbi:MAG: Uncharacterized protein CEN92_490 [Candidatus Berkelbacteria bacterium Licking1014_96]|uniref:DUF5673 domain-containing protein n=1 Tax=Candidatus Berkelbacteria bacterium Licking1014_96 TaxID=2017149 RepID=A0A554LBM7_9BACT|nr:MAG: Uncharacterized protein CEN92_490 [Candidatus Berkelbacteria bacterium Licking1014_96]